MKKLLLLSLLITQQSFAEMMCDDATDYWAEYEINTYTCESGYFLPANTMGCQPCPTGFTCNGGTFEFNPDIYQGAELNAITTTTANACAVNFPTDLFAIYEKNKHTCLAGYYLLANNDECTICPADNYCPGGTYTFNETMSQGINACPSAHPFAPAGMWQESQCGRKLHVGDDVMYLHQRPANPTEHRLFVRVGNTVYSANTVLRDINSENTPKMSAGATKSLHVTINNVEYLVCDDSVE